jgi:hypothetical protein
MKNGARIQIWFADSGVPREVAESAQRVGWMG